MQWIIQNPSRLLAERRAIEELSKEPWLSSVRWLFDREVKVEFDLDLGVKKFELVLTYPDFFPDTPAFIRPRDSSSRLTNHQYGAGGSLCLEHRPDNWHSEVTGADLIRSAYKLLSSENLDGAPPAPSAHLLSLGQRLRGEPFRFVSTSATVDRLTLVRRETGALATCRVMVHAEERVVFVSQLEDSSGKQQHVGDQPFNEDVLGPVFTYEAQARVFRVGDAGRNSTVASLDSLGTLVNQPTGLEVLFPDSTQHENSKSKNYFVLLVGERPTWIRAFRILVGETTHLIELAVIPAETVERLPSEHKTLANKKVAIVGLGSIGSKLAVSLARSGVRKFLLIDDDFLLPGNLRRNELSWIGVGVHKVKAVKELIHLVSADCDVEDKIFRMAGQESSRDGSGLFNAIAGCDLIVDATANAEVFVNVAAIARRKRIPLCWGELFAGGIGGLIARARPDADPNPLAVRNGILAFLGQQPPAPYQNAINYDMDEIRPLTAYDADVGHISCAMTRFAIDALLYRAGGMFPYTAYAIGLRKEWIFSWPFDVHPIKAEGDGWELQANTSDEEQRAALEFLAAIAAETKR